MSWKGTPMENRIHQKDQTVFSSSKLGEHLHKIKKEEIHHLLFQGKEIAVVTEIVIGRSPRCNIVVDDKLCSREHAFIQKIKDEYFIKDLESTNGTRINDILLPPNKYVKLKFGDSITVGKLKLIFN